MNLLVFLHDILTEFSAAPTWAQLLTKVTLLLAVAWVVHFGLARANPRWRTLLWRGTAVGLVLMGVWIPGLPGWEIRFDTPQPVSSAPASSLPPVVAQSDPALPANEFVHPIRDPASVERAVTTHPMPVEIQPEAARPIESLGSSLSWSMVLLGIWGFGVTLLVIRLAIALVGVMRLLRTSQAAPKSIAAEVARIAASLGCHRQVQVRTSRRYAVPFQYGLRRPLLVLPERMCQPAYRGQLPAVIAHELIHVVSRDFGWNVVLQVVSTILWFHPLAWRIGFAHRTACDAVCDAVAASYLGNVPGYCRTLAQVALESAGMFPVMGLPMARTCNVRRRIARLQQRVFAATLGRRAVIVAASAGLLSFVLLAGVRFALAEPSPADKNAEVPAVSAHSGPEDVPVDPTAAVSQHTDLYGDPLPPGAIARLGSLRYRCPVDLVLNAITFASDKTIVTPTRRFGVPENASFCYWDATSGRLLRKVRPENIQEEESCGDAITPDARIAVAHVGRFVPNPGGNAFPQFQIRWWNVDTGAEIASLWCGDCTNVRLAVSRDGVTVAGGEPNRLGMVRVWNRVALKETASYQTTEGVHDIAVSPDGMRVMFITQREGVWLWDFASGQGPRTILPRSNDFRPWKAAFSPDGMTLIVGGWKGNVKVFDLFSGQLKGTLDWPHPNPAVIAFSRDRKQFALADAGDRSNNIGIWDLASGKLLHTFDGPGNWGVNGMAFSPDGHLLGVATPIGLEVWDLKTEKCLNAQFVGHEGMVGSVVFLGQSETVATAGSDETVRLWDARTGHQKMTIPHEGLIRGLVASPDGRLLASSAETGVTGSGETGPVRIWDANTGKQLFSLERRAKMGTVWRLSFSADGKRLAGAVDNGKVRVWSVEDGTLLSESELQLGLPSGRPSRAGNPFGGNGLSSLLRSAVFSPNGDGILVNGRGDTFRVFSVKTGKELRTFGDDGMHRYNIALSTDGKRLLSNEVGGRLKPNVRELHLWDLPNGKEIWRQSLPYTGRGDEPIAISVNGKRFAVLVGGTSPEIRICDLATRTVLQTFTTDKCRPRSLDFSPDVRLLVAGMNDGTTIAWDLSPSSAGH